MRAAWVTHELTTAQNEYHTFFRQLKVVGLLLHAVTLEGSAVRVGVSAAGWEVSLPLTPPLQVYESFEALLMVLSPMFATRFHQALYAKLAALESP